MKSLSIETSAVLTWLMGQTHADDVRARVDAAEGIMTSSLTFAETERAVVRAENERLIRVADGQRLRGLRPLSFDRRLLDNARALGIG